MKRFMEKWKADMLLSAVLCTITGIIIMIFPETIPLLLGRVIGIVLVIMGAARGFSYMQNRGAGRLGLSSGVVLCVLGVLLFIRPSTVAQILAIVVGVVLIMHGFEDMQMSMESKYNGDENWWICMLLSAITIMFGIFVIWQYFLLAEVAAWFLGLALVYDGVSDIVLVVKAILTDKNKQ